MLFSQNISRTQIIPSFSPSRTELENNRALTGSSLEKARKIVMRSVSMTSSWTCEALENVPKAG